MDILFYSILLFCIITAAVRLAIMPLIKHQEVEVGQDSDSGLVKLRDMGVLSNVELEEVIALYHKKSVEKGYGRQYLKYQKVLEELKEAGYFSEEQCDARTHQLKEYFKLGQ